MLKSNITTDEDFDEARKLQRRRQYEDERKKRIFNARQRLYGLDLETLDKQRKEQRKIKTLKDECERKWEQELSNQQLSLQEHVLNEEKRRRVLDSDLNMYRCKYQRADQRREFDLNDPNLIKKQQPVRVSDHDPNLGISSAQVFVGEDVGHAERRQRQRTQQRAWLEQQMEERSKAEQARNKADKLIIDSLLDGEAARSTMEQSVDRVRKQTVASIRQYNAELALQKRIERAQEKKERNEDDMAEIYNMLTSDMLSENPNCAQSKTNPNKKVAYLYRGMTPDEKRIFQEGQRQQMIEMEKRRVNEQMKGKLWEQMVLNMDRELQLKELDMDRKRSAQIDEFLEKNAELAKEQRLQRVSDELNKRNVIGADFYNQFNKDSR